VVQPVTGSLTPGVYEATITLLFGDVSRTVSVVFVLNGSSAETVSKARLGRRDAAGTCPTRLLPRLTSFSAGVSVVAGWPTTLSASVVDDCGVPMAGGSVVAQFSNGDPPVVLTPGQPGSWLGTWQAANPSPAVTIKLTALDSGRQLTGTAEVGGSVTSNAGTPAVNPGGVVNAASLAQQRLSSREP
jgi:hypothetical protein